MASDRFEQLWEDANRRVHDRVVALLTTGESGRVRLEGDTVFLDLGPAVQRVRETLQERGLDRLAAAIPPTVDGRITLLQSEGFVKARDGINLLESLTIILPILALLCLGGHVALVAAAAPRPAARRPRADRDGAAAAGRRGDRAHRVSRRDRPAGAAARRRQPTSSTR